MIVVKVELWSAITGERSEIARMWLDNIGGTGAKGDYRARTLRGRSAEAFSAPAPTFQREGRVLGHARLKEHVWNLVSKALAGIGYGSVAPPATSDAAYRDLARAAHPDTGGSHAAMARLKAARDASLAQAAP